MSAAPGTIYRWVSVGEGGAIVLLDSFKRRRETVTAGQRLVIEGDAYEVQEDDRGLFVTLRGWNNEPVRQPLRQLSGRRVSL